MSIVRVSTDEPPYRAARRRALLCAALILLLSATARIRAGCDGFWLDEIWTIQLMPRLTSPWTILTSVHQENNHYLNTFFIWLIGPHANWVVYRIPSMTAGVISVALAGVIARRRNAAAAMFAMVFVGGSYLLIHYSSEARGYSLAVCCALACLDCQERLIRGAGWGAIAGTAASAIAGILSQPVFLAFYGALLVWSAWHMLHPRRARWSLKEEWWLSHFPPLLFFGWLYAVDLGQVINAGGPIYPLANVVVQTLSLSIGGPEGSWQPIGAPAAALGFVASLVFLWRTDRDWCVLAVLAVLVMPALLLVSAGREEVYPRYFVIPAAIINVTFGIALGRLWPKAAGKSQVACLILAASWLIGNSIHVARLFQYGRGSPWEVVAYLNEQTRERMITVASDQDLRNQMVLHFYSRYLPDPDRILYFKRDEQPPDGPEWRLIHSLDRMFVPPPVIRDSRGQSYRLARFYPYAGLSGWGWGIYHIDKDLPVE